MPPSRLKQVAPTMSADPVRAFYMRPVMCDPPLCTLVDLKTVLDIDDLADFHEVLNIREAMSAAQQKANKSKNNGRR